MERLFDEEPPPRERATRAPLAVRMRPELVEEVVGQRGLLAPGAPLRRAIDEGSLHSMILHGPPGSGKTTLARILAQASGAAFEEHSALEVGRAEVRAVIERARQRATPTVFFLDEIHRFNRAQQDALLRAVEEGTLTLIGASTENPRHAVSSALLSRMHVYSLDPLTVEEVVEIIDRAQAREELGEGVTVEPAAARLLAERSGGDARIALGALERATAGRSVVDLAAARAALGSGLVRYDRAGDVHYDTISAWIKATRGSDPDASLYYLATMIEGGEDPRFIARRMLILASEDIGNADPQALLIAAATSQTVEQVGLPECTYALAQAAIYLSLAPKSNAAGRALGAARERIAQEGARESPVHLREEGRRRYDYPHSHAGAVSPQELMPEGLEGVRFYEPTEAESAHAAALERIRKARGR